MPSPFPGMNPYLEGPLLWHGFHTNYIVSMQRALAPRLVPAYIVQTQETLFIHEESAERRRVFAESDVSVAGRAPQAPGGVATTVLDAPTTVRFDTSMVVERHRHLEIRDRAGRQLVTLIELLSPSNKSGADRQRYLDKRNQTLHAGANYVEIDLLRGHGRVAPADLPTCDYYALVARREGLPSAGVWPLRLRDPLPTIPVPLRPPDADATLDLQAVLHDVYDACGYAAYAYDAPPDPPLAPADQAWADAARTQASR